MALSSTSKAQEKLGANSTPTKQSDSAAHSMPARDGGKTSFMDLPIELRTEVYGYLLTESHAIILDLKRSWWPARSERLTLVAKVSHPCSIGKHLALLRINRQVHEEATPVLYGGNCFSFETRAAFAKFLEVLGKRARHLRIVELLRMNWDSSRNGEILSKLRIATKLDKLMINHSEICPSVNQHPPHQIIEWVASDLKPLMVALDESYAREYRSRRAYDALHFSVGRCWLCEEFEQPSSKFNTRPPPHPLCSCHHDCIKVTEPNQELQDLARSKIAAYLDQLPDTEQCRLASPSSSAISLSSSEVSDELGDASEDVHRLFSAPKRRI